MTSTDADKKIRNCIDKTESFILDAAAGSGKTYSLVETLRYLIDTGRGIELARNSQRIVCITFTNAAKDEIIQRTARNPLIHVSTIHDFLWRTIKPYQKALKQALIKHNAGLKSDSKRKCDEQELLKALESFEISYSDTGAKFLEGRIFHNDLLDVARLVFEDNKLMSQIIVARHPFIFVDEYQDTSKSVIEILIDHVLKGNEDRVVIGFFGDKLQNIYHTNPHPGIGRIPDEQGKLLQLITKEENYRCSQAIINLLNNILDFR
jgi:DNA helicase II / ATP-dependent DNA helicase PcrA